MILRRFNEQGKAAFVAFLEGTRSSGARELPEGLLEGEAFTEVVPGCRIDVRGFASKLEFAMYVRDALEPQVPAEMLRSDRLLWLLITACYFGELCKDRQGRAKAPLKDIKHYACAGTARLWPLDKHMLYFPWKLLKLHGEAACWLLGGAFGEDSKVVREFANSKRRNVHTGYLEVARVLYYDAAKGQIRKGSTAERAAGSMRDLDRVMGRLDMTYDIFGESGVMLLRLLPEERFGRWIDRSRVE